MSSNNVEKIKERLSIEEVVGSYIKLEKAGKNLKGKCPFHNEKTPSFYVSPERNSFYCFGCFPPGQLIKTPFGYHTIETLDTNHYVYSGKGIIRKVLATQHREYIGKLVDVEVQKFSGKVSLTLDHTLPIIRPKTKYYKKTKQFYRQVRNYGLNNGEKILLDRKAIEKHADVLEIPAGELKMGDFVLYPIQTLVNDTSTIDLSKYLTKKSNMGPRVRSIPYIVPVDNNLLKLIGYYIAEGSNHRAYIRFSLGNHEEGFAQEIVDLIRDIFGLEAKIHRRKGLKTGLEITACHAYLANIFENLCGKGSDNKHIPYIFQEIPPHKQMQIVNAVNKGDGHTCISDRSSHPHSVITVTSRTLVEQIADILLRNNIFPSMYTAEEKIDKLGVHHKKTYSVSWSVTAIARHELTYDDGETIFWLLPVKKVSKRLYQGPVYNFTVDEDHTYIAKNFKVANCGAKGDIFSFVEQFEGLDFMGALRLLAEKAGIQLEFDKNTLDHKSEKEKLLAIMEDATVFFENELKKSKEAQEYLKKRGLIEETIKKFRIGCIRPDWRLLYDYLKNKKYSDIDIEKAGLIKKPEKNLNETGKNSGNFNSSYYDRFRGRVIFPIMDSSGRVIAFSGRILVDDGKSAKYLNSPDSILFNKSTVLYGIDKAKNDIRIKNYSILVEGQMDLVLSHQAGIKNTVAVSGTALSDTLMSKENVVNNLGIIKRLSNNIILAFDSDNAGRKAAMRSASIALSLGMDVKIADLPEGKDPADLVLSNPEEWKNVLRNSKSVVEFQLSTVLSQSILKKLDARKLPQALRENVFPFIASITGAMEKAHYIKLIKEKTGLSEESIIEDLKKVESSIKKELNEIKVAEENRISVSRLDIIIRKLFGLIYYLDKNIDNKININTYKNNIKEIAGEKYGELINKIEPYKDELLLETEIIYASKKDEDLKKDLDELILNFEDDLIRDEYIDVMKLVKSVGVSEESNKKLNELNKKKLEIENKKRNFK